MAPIDINNQEIDSITLNGNTEIDTVEVNGQTVFSAGPPADAGLHYYIADENPGLIEYYTCPNPYDLANRTLEHTLTGLNRHPGIVLNNDGSRAVVYEGRNSGTYRQYDLTTPWDLSTITNRTDVTNLPDANFGAPQFGDNGDRLYITDTDNGSFVRQFDLSTKYDITTASSAGTNNFGQGGQMGQPAFNSDGTTFYWAERSGSDIYSAPLSTPFDITTAGSVSQFSANSNDPSGLALSFDGSKMFVRHWSPNMIAEYDFSTPFDLSSLSYQQDIFTTPNESASHQFSVNPWQ